ncbi:MAG: DUF1848 domain-containing protein [Deltaproteobacteria bacterium]|nr:DUF1848 domain-containing protein [Deltaproteobacteria bacterium]
MEKEETKELLVISASRRTDLVGCYPDVLVERLREYPPEGAHSVVLWTKNPRNIIRKKNLQDVLANYRQVFIHLTITGMGGGEFEPMIPPWKGVVEMIEPLIYLVGDPRRISWRFDPILIVEGNGKAYSNFDLFPMLAEEITRYGIESCRVSWVSPYKKVLTRLAKKGWRLANQSLSERITQADQLAEVAREYGMNLHFCSMERLPISRCIDGELLSAIHPDGLGCSKEKAIGQRELCGCTKSVDIGWYSLKCKHGCLYCYASP